MEPDYESSQWDDHDENCHGRIDSDFCRSEYPEGFVWDCCNRAGTEDGCRMSRHEADPDKNKRDGRNDDDSASECTYASDYYDEDDEDEEDADDEENRNDGQDSEEGNDRAKKRRRV